MEKVKVTCNDLVKELNLHQGNNHAGNAKCYVNVPGVGVFPLSGGVSTYGDGSEDAVVVLFANIPKKEQ